MWMSQTYDVIDYYSPFILWFEHCVMMSSYVTAVYVNCWSWHVHSSHSVCLLKPGVTAAQEHTSAGVCDGASTFLALPRLPGRGMEWRGRLWRRRACPPWAHGGCGIDEAGGWCGVGWRGGEHRSVGSCVGREDAISEGRVPLDGVGKNRTV
jgi:hypothetical protein